MQKILSLQRNSNPVIDTFSSQNPAYMLKYKNFECRDCNMKFSSEMELHNHKANFCTATGYGNLRSMGNSKALYDSGIKRASSSTDKFKLSDLKEKIKRADDEFDELRTQTLGRTLISKYDEKKFNNFSDFKSRMFVPPSLEDEDLKELKDFLNNPETRNRTYDSERLLIQRELKNYERRILNVKDVEFKKGLESLLKQRDYLKEREENLTGEILRFKDIYYKSENMRLEGDKIDQKFLDERKMKVQTLKVFKNKLENERLYILEGLQKIQNGELQRKNTSSLNAANEILVDGKVPYHDLTFMKGKIDDDAKRLYKMKKDHNNFYGKNFQPFEPEENIKREQKSFHEHLEYVLEANDKLRNIKEKAEKMSVIREYIEKFGLENGLNNARVKLHFRDDNDKMLKEFRQNIGDLDKLRKDYITAGGTDPDFLLNLDNLQQFYAQSKPSISSLFARENTENNNKSLMGNTILNSTANNNINNEAEDIWGSIGGQTSQNLNYNELPEPNRSFAIQADTENSILKKGLMSMQLGTSKINKMIQKNNTSMLELQMKLTGMDPSVEKSFSSKKGLFLKDNVEVESEEEKMLKKIVVEEGDALRNLANLPLDSEIYRIKVQELQPLINYRIELEKIVQEQRFARMREDYHPYSTEAFEIKKKQIAEKLRRNFTNIQGDRRYDNFEGFVVHWDFLLALPKKYDLVRLTFGVFCKGETYYAPRIIEDHKCEAQDYNKNKCIFAEKDHIYDIPSNKDTILVIEMQAQYDDLNQARKSDIFGWTMLELFDMKKDLLRGKFKIPFYSTKTNPNLLVDQLKNLTSVSSTLLYLRISFPRDPEYGHDEAIIPEKLSDEYFVPFIHRKTIIRTINEKEDDDDDDLNVTGRWLPKTGNWSRNMANYDKSFDEKPVEIPKIIEPQMTTIQAFPLPTPPPIIEEPKIEPPKQGPLRKGIYLKINGIRNFMEITNTKIRVALVDLTNIILDEKSQPCSFETENYILPEAENPELVHYIQNLNKNQADISTLRETNLNNKSMNQSTSNYEVNFLEMNEEYIFVTDIYFYCLINNAWENIYLIFQTLVEEKHEIDPNLHFVDKPLEDNTEKIFQGYTWLPFKCFTNNSLNVGRHLEHNVIPPLLKPPFEIELQKTEDVLDFIIQEYIYDINQLDDVYDKLKAKREQKKRKIPKDKKKNTKDKWANIDLDKRPFIENLKSQYHDRPFEKGFGIDFYIDGARFLPDNVTVSKVVLFIMNQNLDRMIPPQAGLPELESYTYAPIFSFRQELRAPHFDPTLMALISLETVDQTNKEVRIVGYSAINFFISRSTKKQPTMENDTEVILLDGKYQLPIYCQEPLRKKPFNMESMSKLDRIPCGSLLVRTNLAPMTEDGLRALTLNDVPQKDWEKKKLWVPNPPYGLGQYNTSFCPLRDSEKELFFIRQKRGDTLVKESALKMISYDNIQEELSQAKMKEWIDTKIKRTNNTEIIDMIYFAKYQITAGFKFSLDGFHNSAVSDLPLIGLYCLNPPAALYEPLIIDPNSILLNSNLDWESPLSSPKYNEGFFTWKDQIFNKNLSIIIDVRSVYITGRRDKIKIDPVAWTIVPVFTPNGYVKSGCYQMPLIKGPVKRELLKELANNDPWEYLMEIKNNKKSKLSFLEPMSAVVRLLDAQREGHFQIPFDHSRMNYIYLPPGKAGSYTYNSAVEQKLKSSKKLVSIAPNKFKTNEYNDSLTQAVVQQLGIKHFAKDKV